VLGSTGSIGRQTLDVVRHLPQRFRIAGLAAGNNVSLLAEQVEEFRPDFVFCSAPDTEQRRALGRLPANCRVLPLEEMASHRDVDMVVVATSGKVGLDAVLAAVRAGKQVALANKEALVMAGGIIMREAGENGAQVLPVDSEHSAVWQCLRGESGGSVRRIILTASGGPFRGYSAARLQEVDVEQALRHPSWTMGRKVTIDSATLMNKGLEVIEAHWLFSVPVSSIRVLVHPQSIIHSMVEFADGSLKAQLSWPDMRLPIQYALSYPERLPNDSLPRLDWDGIGRFDFERPDYTRFPCLRLGIEAGEKGGTYPAALCAADEVAVALFLEGRIRFVDIAGVVEKVLAKHCSVAQPALEDIMAADGWAREAARALAGGSN